MNSGKNTVYGGFLDQVRAHPDALAADDGTHRLTYLELAQMAAAIRDALPDGRSCIGVVTVSYTHLTLPTTERV